MIEELQPDWEIVELGDAKDETKGFAVGMDIEDVPTKMYERPV